MLFGVCCIFSIYWKFWIIMFFVYVGWDYVVYLLWSLIYIGICGMCMGNVFMLFDINENLIIWFNLMCKV